MEISVFGSGHASSLSRYRSAFLALRFSHDSIANPTIVLLPCCARFVAIVRINVILVWIKCPLMLPDYRLVLQTSP